MVSTKVQTAGEIIGIEALVEQMTKLSLRASGPVDARHTASVRRGPGRAAGVGTAGMSASANRARADRWPRWAMVARHGLWQVGRRRGARESIIVHPSGVLEGKDIHPPKLALSLPSGQLSVKKSQPLRVMIVVQAARLLLYRRAACTTKKSQPLRVMSRRRRIVTRRIKKETFFPARAIRRIRLRRNITRRGCDFLERTFFSVLSDRRSPRHFAANPL